MLRRGVARGFVPGEQEEGCASLKGRSPGTGFGGGREGACRREGEGVGGVPAVEGGGVREGGRGEGGGEGVRRSRGRWRDLYAGACCGQQSRRGGLARAGVGEWMADGGRRAAFIARGLFCCGRAAVA
jgi:hypothetical protein